MRLKSLSLLAGAIALTVTTIPFAVQAQIARSSSPQMAQMMGGERGGMKGPWQRLNLTDAQKAQMQTIRSNTRDKIEAVLTPEQKEAAQNQMKKKVWADLTEEQKTQIRQIRELSKEQMLQVLTPEQRQQLEETRENMRSRRGRPNFQ
ncbi:Spy/CpxP family protein refolding chaperone [Chrysosporum bergii ANA360D]|uniref:Spy/CpxP family protein refolding chaperone n=1 Tax=Chrysosporum bergii ANA360D TaxID=617107 RepID=A0AA43GRA2_9CYAN|nr:Spy/CpxP family protein refolding chaperone [Chrysosporum bergii]MDH6060160.1 Spy/CpxP family protein refolding chaperone [Chrysosporum bergii ANA360D]